MVKIHLGCSLQFWKVKKGEKKEKKFYSSVMTWSWLSRDHISTPCKGACLGEETPPARKVEEQYGIYRSFLWRRLPVVPQPLSEMLTIQSQHGKCWLLLLGACVWRPSCLQTANLFIFPSGIFTFNEAQLHQCNTGYEVELSGLTEDFLQSNSNV